MFDQVVNSVEYSLYSTIPTGMYLPVLYGLFALVVAVIGRDLLRAFSRGYGFKAIIVCAATLYACGWLAGWW